MPTTFSLLAAPSCVPCPTAVPRHGWTDPRANLSAAVEEAAAFGVRYSAFAVSGKLLEAELVAAARAQETPLDVWVIDDEPTLRLALTSGVHGVITNQPLWAKEHLREWHTPRCQTWKS